MRRGHLEAGGHRRGAVRVDPAQPQLQLVPGLPQGPPPDPFGPAGRRPRDVGDRVVAELGQVLDGAAHPAVVVDGDAGDVGHLPVQQHQRLLLGDHADRRVAHPRAGQHRALDQAERAFHDAALGRADLGGVGQQQRVAGQPGRLLAALDDLVVERVRDVGDHEPDRPGLPAERSGDRVGPVADALGRLEDQPGGLRVDPPGTGVGPGHGGGGDAGGAGDVVDRRAIAHPATVGGTTGAGKRPGSAVRPPGDRGPAVRSRRLPHPGPRRGQGAMSRSSYSSWNRSPPLPAAAPRPVARPGGCSHASCRPSAVRSR